MLVLLQFISSVGIDIEMRFLFVNKRSSQHTHTHLNQTKEIPLHLLIATMNGTVEKEEGQQRRWRYQEVGGGSEHFSLSQIIILWHSLAHFQLHSLIITPRGLYLCAWLYG